MQVAVAMPLKGPGSFQAGHHGQRWQLDRDLDEGDLALVAQSILLRLYFLGLKPGEDCLLDIFQRLFACVPL